MTDWTQGYAQCEDCKWLWRAVCPKETTEHLECPNCHKMDGAIVYTITEFD
jgi:Zn finger protein HypA/HybF involved in hydrogenase expression